MSPATSRTWSMLATLMIGSACAALIPKANKTTLQSRYALLARRRDHAIELACTVLSARSEVGKWLFFIVRRLEAVVFDCGLVLF